MFLRLRFLVVLFASVVLVASKCFEGDELVTAQCDLRPRGGDVSGIEGKVDIIQVTSPDTGVSRTYLKIKITGLQPNSTHGFHIHQLGEIFGPQGCKGAGGHYNPLNRTHGSQTDTERHVGDFGNVYADKNGVVMVIKSNRDDLLTGEHSVLGRAIVLHAKRDDLGRGGDEGSAKTGNAGARIACGVIVNT